MAYNSTGYLVEAEVTGTSSFLALDFPKLTAEQRIMVDQLLPRLVFSAIVLAPFARLSNSKPGKMLAAKGRSMGRASVFSLYVLLTVCLSGSMTERSYYSAVGTFVGQWR